MFGFRLAAVSACLVAALYGAADVMALEKSVTVTEAGTLSTLIPAEEKDSITNLTVSGPLNGTDILFIREMAGRDQWAWRTGGNLEQLNMKDATFVAGGDSYAYSATYTKPDTLSSNMFAECDMLKTVVLPSTVKVIETCAFYRCNGLESVEIPATVTEIQSNAFFLAKGLKSMFIPKGVEKIEDAVFCGTSSLLAFEVDPENQFFSTADGVLVSKDGSRLLACPGGKTGTYDVPATITAIAPAAFNECGLSGINVNEGVTEIGDAAFSNSMYLTSVHLPNSLKYIEHDMFVWCDALTDLVLGNELESIGKRAFVSCWGLKALDLPESLKEIGEAAFSSCKNLESVKIGKNLETLGLDAFVSCKKLAGVEISAENPNFKSIDGIIYNGDATKLIKCVEGKTGDIVIPESTTELDIEAFFRCANITAVTMSDNVTTIGSICFDACSSMQSIKLSKNLQTVSDYMLNGCSSLTTLDLGNCADAIGEFAFSSCSELKSVIIPATVKTIATDAFTYCRKLEEIHCLGEVPPVCAGLDLTFYMLKPENIKVYVPENALTEYEEDEVWGKFNLQTVSGVASIPTADGEYEVYTLGGRKVTNTEALESGIYLYRNVKTGAVTKRVK